MRSISLNDEVSRDLVALLTLRRNRQMISTFENSTNASLETWDVPHLGEDEVLEVAVATSGEHELSDCLSFELSEPKLEWIHCVLLVFKSIQYTI